MSGEELHPTLARQLKRCKVTDFAAPPDAKNWQKLLQRVNAAYVGADEDRYTLQRSMEVSERELTELHRRMGLEHERLNVVFDSQDSGVVEVDSEWRAVRINAAAAALLGLSATQLPGRPLHEVVSLLDKNDENVLARAAEAESETREPVCRVVLGDEAVDVTVVVTPLATKDGTGAVIAISDVSQLRDATRKAEAARVEADAAVRADQAKSEFLANMSHELRTPLNAVIGYSEMVSEDLEGTEGADLIPDVMRIHSAGRHLLRLINDILDLSKIEAGRMEVMLEDVALGEVVDDCVATTRPMADKSGATLVVGDSSSLPLVRADSVRLRQCLMNLLSNAAKFTPDGTITIHFDEVGPDVLIHVTDDGIGMTDAQQAVVFEAFQQADSSTTREYGGTGLGLALTRRFMQMVGGEVSVRSALGEGSTFTMRVPVCQSQPATMVATTRTAPVVDSGAPVVYVVEDDPASGDLLIRMLERDGYVVRLFETGRAGLDAIRADAPDVVLLDVMLPDLDGWSILSALKADDACADIPVVLHTMLDNRQLGMSLGAADFLAKPVDRSQLMMTLRKQTGVERDGLVLLVEDDEALRDLTGRILRRDGWRVVEAGNGAAALVALEREKDLPQCVLLDLMMPVMDGFTFLEQVRSTPRLAHLPVVVLTARSLSRQEADWLSERSVKVVVKGSAARGQLLNEVRARVAEASTRRATAARVDALAN